MAYGYPKVLIADFVCAVRGRPLMARALISLIRDAGGLDDPKCQGLAEGKAS